MGKPRPESTESEATINSGVMLTSIAASLDVLALAHHEKPHEKPPPTAVWRPSPKGKFPLAVRLVYRVFVFLLRKLSAPVQRVCAPGLGGYRSGCPSV